MAKIFNLKKKITNKSLDDYYSEQYRCWRKMKESRGTYFILFKDFQENHLRDISSGSLKLLIYYGFQSKNETGESWHSISTIAQYFTATEKTINNWNRELEARGLISRVDNGKANSKYTWLLPFSTNYIPIEIPITEYIEQAGKSNFAEVYGKIDTIYHFFQWRSNKPKATDKSAIEYNVPYNTIVIVTKKSYEMSDGSSKSRLTLHEHKCTSEFNYAINIKSKKLYDDIYKFESCSVFNGYVVNGIAVHGTKNIEDISVMMDLIEELYDPDTNLEAYKTVELVKVEGVEE